MSKIYNINRKIEQQIIRLKMANENKFCEQKK